MDGVNKMGSQETPGSVEKHMHTYIHTGTDNTHIHTHTLKLLNKIPIAYNLNINTQLFPAEGSGWREESKREVGGTQGLCLKPECASSPRVLWSARQKSTLPTL